MKNLNHDTAKETSIKTLGSGGVSALDYVYAQMGFRPNLLESQIA